MQDFVRFSQEVQKQTMGEVGK